MQGTNKFICVCGFEGNAGHSGKCIDYQKEANRVEILLQTYIADFYKKTYSITDCCKYVKEKEATVLNLNKLRTMITKYLNKENLKEPFNGKQFNAMRQEKTKKTMLAKYGVINAGQITGNGFGKQNAVPLRTLRVNDEFMEYRKKINYLSRKHLEKEQKLNIVPSTCHYTGLTFVDNLSDEVNPNDPFKRTIDHKVSVTEAFFLGWPPEKTAYEDNMVYCLRVVNTVKGNTSETEFRKFILPALIERLINESN